MESGLRPCYPIALGELEAVLGNPYRSKCRDGVTQEYVRERFGYDSYLGDLYWRISPCHAVRIGDWAYSTYPDKKSGNHRKTVRVNGGRVPQSHVIWMYFYGKWPEDELDHKDRNPLNDRILNLRDSTTSQNCMNQVAKCNNKCGFKGVIKHSQQNAFWVRISAGGRRYNLGLYPTAELAAGAYRIAAAAIHGEFSGV